MKHIHIRNSNIYNMSQTKYVNQSQKQLIHNDMPLNSPRISQHKLNMKRMHTISDYQSETLQQLSQITIQDQNQIKLRQTILKIKTNRISMIFIKKLKINACIGTRFPYLKKVKNYRVILTRMFQILYHLIILLHYVSILLLLLMTSWTATLNKFSQDAATTPIVYGIKYGCLSIFVIQQITNFISHFFKHNIRIGLTYSNIKEELLSYNYISNLIKIIFLVFFIIYPTNQTLAALFFIFLVISLFIGVTQLAHLQAAYIHTQKRDILWRISKILSLNIFMIHIVATVVMAMTHINQENNWFVKYDLVDTLWQYQYITSYYWSTIIVTTIGFGDISPQTHQEQLIISFLALIACILLTFNITMFSQAFAKLKENYQSVQTKTVMFRRMIRRDYKNNVDMDSKIKKRIYNYIDSLSTDKTQLEFIQKNDFLSQLPAGLRNDYYKSTNKRLFSSIVFINSLRNSTLSALSQKFSVVFLSANDLIYPNDLQIKVLEQGHIGLTYLRTGSTVNGSVFDQIKVNKRQNIVLLNSDFLSMQKQSNFNMIAHQFTVMWTISIDHFVNILRSDIIDFQYYFTILHKYSYDENQWQTIECPRCSTKIHVQKHSCFKCPAITYMPMKKIAIQKSCILDTTQQTRKIFVRNKDAAPRTSVLKYWKNYLKKNYEMQHKRDVSNHMENIVRKSKIFAKNRKTRRITNQKIMNRYYLDKQRYQIIQEERYLNFEVDIPFNFQFYFPKFNPDQLIFTHVENNEGFRTSTVIGTLKNVMHVKGHKFNKRKLGK